MASEVWQSKAAGAGPDDGHPWSLSSYRLELGGILAALYIIHRISVCYQVSSGKAKLYCDNKWAVNKVFGSPARGITPFLTADHDLIYAAHNLLISLPIMVVGEWVKGHYPGKNRLIKHNLNNEADALASEHLCNQSQPFKTKPCPAPNPGFRARMLYRNTLITSKFYAALASAHHEKDLYIMRKNYRSNETFHKVNWLAHAQANCRLTIHQKISTAKTT